jgi:DNA-binding PadR family transcriptional regulator
VSETRDKRHRSDLDLFVLALVAEGVSTPYLLKTAANLSPGATIPALRRLLEDGSVVQARPGPRGRADHRMTAEGKRRLRNGWRELIEQGPSGDLDADLRVALLAIWIGSDRRSAAAFLKGSAARKLKGISPNENLDKPTSTSALALWYRQMRLASATALAKGESNAALAMARVLPRAKPIKKDS